MSEPKIVITGTGRAGTTLLVQVLDVLGMDTGLHDGKLSPFMPSVRAGLECRVDDPDVPTVVKDMTLGHRINLVLDSTDVQIRHVIIPDRKMEIAAASRIRAADYGRLPFRRGALTGTIQAREQAAILVRMRADIIDALERHDIPYTLLEFPRFASDPAYLFDQLGFLVPAATVTDFERALARCVRPELIHQAPLSVGERLRTLFTGAWMRWVRMPISKVRNRLDPEGAQARLRASVKAARAEEERLLEEEGLPARSSTDE